MHWCSRHLFSACHTYHKKCTYTRACTPIWQCSNFFVMKPIANYVGSWKPLSILRQTKNIELNHDDALAEPNIQHRACWFNRTAPARYHHSTSYVCLLYPFVLPKIPSSSTPAHDAVAAALPYRHHLIIHVVAGPIQLVYGSSLLLAVELILNKIGFLPWFLWAFWNVANSHGKTKC